MKSFQTSQRPARLETQLTALAFQRSGACFMFQDQDLRILMLRNPPTLLTAAERNVESDADLFGTAQSDRLRPVKQQVLANATPQTVEIDIPDDNGISTFHIAIERIAYEGKNGLLSVISDITTSRHRERVLKTLLRELSHRSKNLLAIILGIATQTARQAQSLEAFLVKFRGRIQSLSNSQDLVTDSSWRGAFLFELAHRQLAPYWPDPKITMPFEGVNAHLSPNAALHVGLALHELIVNSASHGAISLASNRLKITCSQTHSDNGKAIVLAWTEQRPAAVTDSEADEPNTFAHTVLERVVPAALGGSSRYIEDTDRVEYYLTIPEREYEIIDG